MSYDGLSHESLKVAKRKTIGIKETRKALERGEVRVVYIARDAEEHVVRGLKEMCNQKGIPIVHVETMAQLGKACGIEVGAASAAILRE